MALKDSLSEIEKLKIEWDNLQPLSKENSDRLWRKMRLEWNYNSNNIEGNTLTYGETELLLMFDKTTGDHELREYEEMNAHDVAIHTIRDWANDHARELTEADIRSLNKLILVRPFWKEAITYDGQPTRRLIKVGEYKEHPNSVRTKTGEIFHYAKPEDTERLMNELIVWNKANNAEHPLLVAASLHYQYIRIHPFDDGNGRIARLLVNYVLLRNGYPPIIIKSADKDNYLTALRKADVGDLESFYDYIAKQLIWSLEIAIKAAKGENIEEQDDLDKELKLLDSKFKNNSEQAEKRTAELQKSIFEQSLIPLLNGVYERSTKFNHYFVDFEIDLWSDGKAVSRNWSDIQSWLSNVSGTLNMYSMQFNFLWNGFKNAGTSAFSVRANLYINLSDYNYQINITKRYKQKADIENLYTQQPSEKQIEFIKTEIARQVLNSIKENYKNATGKDL